MLPSHSQTVMFFSTYDELKAQYFSLCVSRELGKNVIIGCDLYNDSIRPLGGSDSYQPLPKAGFLPNDSFRETKIMLPKMSQKRVDAGRGEFKDRLECK